MRRFVKKAAAALLAGTMAMSLTACAGFTPSGGDNKKDAPASSEAGADTGVTQADQTSGEKKTIKFFHRFPDEPFNQKEGLIPRSLLRNKLFQDMEEVIY